MNKSVDDDENEFGNFTQEHSWTTAHKSYWNSVAGSYDSLYQSTWSKYENTDIQNRLAFLQQFNPCRVLDLGSGTGLGYEICRRIAEIDYVGIDISLEMTKIGREKYPFATFIQGTMNNLHSFPDNSFHVVISLFGAMSYEMNTHKTIKEIYRVLNENGVAFICVMSRWSLRRLIRLKFLKIENYATRGTKESISVPSNVFTVSDLCSQFLQAEFHRVDVAGQGLFSGVIEHPLLWKLDHYIVKRVPHLGHLLIVTASKQKGEGDA